MDPKRSLPPEPIVRRLSAGGSRIRNHRSHVTRPSFSAPAHVTCLTPARGKVGANENRYYEDAGRLPRNRWFESIFLQRRVRCEPVGVMADKPEVCVFCARQQIVSMTTTTWLGRPILKTARPLPPSPPPAPPCPLHVLLLRSRAF